MTASLGATSPTVSHGRRTLVIWNPSAGLPTALRPGGSVADLSEVLERHGVTAEVHEPADEAAARAIVRQAVSDRVDVVVAAGGDGTVHLVAEDLLGTETALGILPLGRVMNIARALGIERDIDVAADVLRDGEVRAIDTGEAVRVGRSGGAVLRGRVGRAERRDLPRGDARRPGRSCLDPSDIVGSAPLSAGADGRRARRRDDHDARADGRGVERALSRARHDRRARRAPR